MKKSSIVLILLIFNSLQCGQYKMDPAQNLEEKVTRVRQSSANAHRASTLSETSTFSEGATAKEAQPQYRQIKQNKRKINNSKKQNEIQCQNRSLNPPSLMFLAGTVAAQNNSEENLVGEIPKINGGKKLYQIILKDKKGNAETYYIPLEHTYLYDDEQALDYTLFFKKNKFNIPRMAVAANNLTSLHLTDLMKLLSEEQLEQMRVFQKIEMKNSLVLLSDYKTDKVDGMPKKAH